MNYITKYVIDISDTHQIYFYEQSNQVYFGVEQKCDETTYKISESEYGIYGNFIYSTFNGCIYKTNIKELTIKLLMYDIYNANYLHECIVATKKHKNRLDTMIKLIPSTDIIESLGNHITPNTYR